MRRRSLVLAVPALVAAPWAFAQAADARVRSLDAALRWLERVERSPNARTTGAWPIGTVLQHLAQSIEMSIDGYPAPRSAVFQHTAGSAAFAFFKWRGRMSHALNEPIPGAPALMASSERPAAINRLHAAIARFQGHRGVLKPHFAYGDLSKADYALAHSMHIGNHQEEVVL
ncbi:DUF1569 domain-containing protein [Caenimonas sedimenti]|uniref:DUF1569 domain-containing protein n=1 Tax=Caenimonas sedimenti TaxID=2596921 RepID=A0A562ZQP9_9BURK|nr:DUF1569 domain-containing protein [Caenimonas sedimenti]TWO70717.1 DUF1569 domain-containing protein [Caenimonas sedimenti]